MVGPALASSFRQQATSDAANGGKGYGSYGYSNSSHNNGDEYSRGAYRRPSEDGSRGAYGSYNSNSNSDAHQQYPQQSMPSSSSSMPYSATRAGAGQNYQLQNSRPADDMQGSYGGANSSYPNGRPSSPTSTINGTSNHSGAPPSSNTGNTGLAGGSSTSKNTAHPAGSPEEIENSRRVARTHFDEFRAYLDAEGQRGESLFLFRHWQGKIARLESRVVF
jgi:hypothetical protein